jgi:hypothetical protein
MSGQLLEMSKFNAEVFSGHITPEQELVEQQPLQDYLGATALNDTYKLSEADQLLAEMGIELDDSLFDFDSKLDDALERPDDDAVYAALQESYNAVKLSGRADHLVYMAAQLAAAACNHSHVESMASDALDSVLGGNDTKGEDVASDSKEKKDDHGFGCMAKHNKKSKCSCGKTGK